MARSGNEASAECDGGRTAAYLQHAAKDNLPVSTCAAASIDSHDGG